MALSRDCARDRKRTPASLPLRLAAEVWPLPRFPSRRGRCTLPQPRGAPRVQLRAQVGELGPQQWPGAREPLVCPDSSPRSRTTGRWLGPADKSASPPHTSGSSLHRPYPSTGSLPGIGPRSPPQPDLRDLRSQPSTLGVLTSLRLAQASSPTPGPAHSPPPPGGLTGSQRDKCPADSTLHPAQGLFPVTHQHLPLSHGRWGRTL